MKKSNLLSVLIFIIILGCFVTMCTSSSSGKISITNNTDVTISNLKIQYSNSDEDSFDIPQLSKGETYDLNLELPDNFSEGYIKICYLDNQNEVKEEYIEGYSKNIDIKITSIDSNSILTFDFNISK